ncbi:nuclear transport factor 2 family protein [Streptomyces sp. NPDC004667]|uniref:nuclear transport factor 2 family protein n=1 Tax=Streptomyces sp. NPDC004667 TaxID=3154285 RepID=UPI0033BB2B58
MKLTEQRVRAAYEALATLDKDHITTFWAEDVRFLTPGRSVHSGWRHGIDDTIRFLRTVRDVSGGSLETDMSTILIDQDRQLSIDLFSTRARREGSRPESRAAADLLSFDGVHVLKWSDGRIHEGTFAIFGDGTRRYDQWWKAAGLADGATGAGTVDDSPAPPRNEEKPQ